jgi:hypothetical protein
VLSGLLWKKKSPCNMKLFVLHVARDLDELHPVPESGRDRLDHVGGRNEHDFGKVERNLQIVITEGVVLLRIQYFQQGR